MSTIAETTTSITAAVNANTPANLANDTLASNFTTFLQLLTTQLKNQNPLDPLDTNQFTQQLVQFAQVEQQLKSNTQLETLVSLQKTAQSTQALGFVGHTVAIDGQTSRLTSDGAGWSFNSPKPASATINILNSAGATVFTGSYSLNSGIQNFVWDGRNNSGVKQPDGDYTLSITAKDAAGQGVAVSTEIQGVVDSVDLSKSPPTLSVNNTDHALDKIKRVVRQLGAS
ncbi:MAG: flagellar hook assembly protein FlgD [Pseudorhodoplanes sp.]|uniref:flagellar hook assembly protein FlgD n=1 Tax=Pseudorhodoplanes sp. TaxID=1934341 RepID=UPI003D10FC7C